MNLTKLKILIKEVEKDALQAHGIPPDRVRIKSVAMSWRFESSSWEFEIPFNPVALNDPDTVIYVHLFLSPG